MHAVICAMHPFLGEPFVPPSILPGRLVDSNSFGSHLAYMSPVQVRTKSSWICWICYALPNGIVRTQWHCSLIATSTTGCSKFYTLEQQLTGPLTVLRGISLIYGVWQPYKQVCNTMWHKFFPLFLYITAPVFGAGARIYNHPKLIVMEKTIAPLFLAALDVRAQLRLENYHV